MKPRSLIIVGCLFVLAFGLLGLGRCGYDKLDDFRTLENIATSIRKEFPDVEHIETGTLAQLLKLQGTDAPLLVDSRTEEEYSVSHMPGAVNLETPEEVTKYLEEQGTKERPVILYCSVGYRSAVLADKLRESGMGEVRNVVGSIFAWANEERPLVDDTGNAVQTVHPYNQFWGRLLKEEFRAKLD